MIYLAAPYSHHNPSVVSQRMELFVRIDGMLAIDGKHTVSPLYKTILSSQYPTMQLDWNTWQEYCRQLLHRCDSILIICMTDWELSIGVREEIMYAQSIGKTVQYFNLHDHSITDYPVDNY